MGEPRTFLYFGSDSESEIRVCLRKLPVSPRTWLHASADLSFDLRERLLSLEGNTTGDALQLFSRNKIPIYSDFQRLVSTLATRACDTLMIYGWQWQTFQQHSQSLKAILELSCLREFDLHLFLLTENLEASRAADEFFKLRNRATPSIQFWMPTQTRDLLLIQRESKQLLKYIGEMDERLASYEEETHNKSGWPWKVSPRARDRLSSPV